jgi:formylglycine-generating enzyme required for sulfatase activity
MRNDSVTHPTCFFSLISAGLMLALSSDVQAQLQLGISLNAQPLVTVNGPTGAVVEVQWSDSLTAPGRWFYLTNRTLASVVQVADPNPPEIGARFYRAVLLPSADMVLIPGGSSSVGDTFNEGFPNEKPVHPASVSSYYLQRTELRSVDWGNVYVWALEQGYAFENDGGGKGPTHPVHTVNWYDAVKWCNAKSQLEGRTPVYYTSAEQTNVYRTGRIDLSPYHVRWSADGYRLPTEAEWERAARSGEAGWRFPWGNTISHSNANYYATAVFTYDLGGNNVFHPNYDEGDFPFTSPVGSFPPNSYGAYDLVGNVWEWCWDAYDPSWYDKAGASLPDPRGPGPGFTNRVMRGGSWIDDASQGRCANRLYTPFQNPNSTNDSIGFRYAMALPGYLAPAVLNDAAQLPNGSFRFTLYNLTPGKTNIVESSTNLVNWSAIATNVPSMALLNFTNIAVASPSGRYYRSRQLP